MRIHPDPPIAAVLALLGEAGLPVADLAEAGRERARPVSTRRIRGAHRAPRAQ